MKVLYIVAGIIMAISGIFGICRPGLTFVDMTWFFGGVLIVAGFSGIASYFTRRKEQYMSIWFFIKPLITVLIGLFFILKAGLTDLMIGYLFALWLCTTGVLQIIAVWQNRKSGAKAPIWSILLGVLQVLLGIFAAVRPLISVMALGMMIGLAFLVYGLSLILTGLNHPGPKQKLQKKLPEFESDIESDIEPEDAPEETNI